MKLDDSALPLSIRSNSDSMNGLTKLEYMSIEFLKAMLTGHNFIDEALQDRAVQAVKAARILAKVLEAEKGR